MSTKSPASAPAEPVASSLPSMEAAADSVSALETAGMLWKLARPIFVRWWPLILLHIALSILTLSVLQGAATVLLGQLTNAIAGRPAGILPAEPGVVATQDLSATLIPLFALWAGVLAASVVAGFAQKFVTAIVDSRIGMDMQRATFSALLRQDLSYFHSQGKSPGELVMTLNHLTVQVQMAARTLLVDSVVQLISLLIIGVLLLHSLADLAASGSASGDVRIWWICGAVVAVGGLCSWWINSYGPDLHGASQNLQAAMMRMNTLLTSVMTSPDEVKVLQAEALFEKEHLAAALHMQQQKLALARKLEITNTLRTIPADLVQAALIGFAVLLVVLYPAGGALKPGILITIVGLTPQFMMVMEMIAGWRAEIAMSSPAIRSISEILQTQAEPVSGSEPTHGPHAKEQAPSPPAIAEDVILEAPEIAARGVTFSYPNSTAPSDSALLQNVDFTLPGGQITALVAPSGMGKTTLFRLLLRFYEPQRGDIWLQGNNLRQISTSALRRQCTLISQRPAFFQGTVRTNFLAANPNATDEEIRAIAESYGLWPILTASYGPQPLDAPFFHGSASRLSGGQEKRFALVRGMLNSPALLLLDEPTTGIDPFEKTLLTAPLIQACQGRTTILVDHDILWQASICHYIVVLDDGSVIDEGPREELMSRPGPFMDMYQEAQRSQMQSPPEPFPGATAGMPGAKMLPGHPVIHAGGRPDFDGDDEDDNMDDPEGGGPGMGRIIASQKVMPFGPKHGARKPF